MVRCIQKLYAAGRRLALILVVLPALAFSRPLQVELNRIHREVEREQIESGYRVRLGVYINAMNPRKDALQKGELLDELLLGAHRLQIPPGFEIDGEPVVPIYFLAALVAVESSFRQEAHSHADARGYMQLLPSTVAWMNANLGDEDDPTLLFQTRVNIKQGVRYLNYLIHEMNDIRLVCLAYNAGPGNVRRGYWVERYWTKILSAYRDIRDGGYLVQDQHPVVL